MSPRRWVAMSCMALLTAAAIYVHALWSGEFATLLPLDEYCTSRPLGSPYVSWTWFPIRHLCHWEDGTTTDLVPAYVNPILVTSLVGAVLCMVMAVRARRRER
ncbi:hypothetical protein Ppa06_25710 [Planomonospora parontospora subsp. parontospora]|uniref:Transmembrane protein n=3 Tax=Planomonospora parontospora TaxID=58119 RepID=A0AA37BEN2_9ACTN|nr:hypothetical protein GCM10010126_19970 [Planomonospora parontospora]GII08773.1 hypothetical protein Ppa06_25710 [Planomonospora parontospora subsp. parontospora]